jgi:type VI secretion system secreted protein VgrG
MPSFSLDLQSFFRVATYVLIFFGLYAIWRGRAAIRASADLPFFRLRQQQLAGGWRTIFVALLLFAGSAWLAFYGERTAYSIFPVTATPSQTPTLAQTLTPSLTPSETLTPSITPTLQFSLTPSPSAVPVLPPEVAAQFSSVVTPNPAAVFSPLTFARRVNLDTYLAVDAGTVFANPVGSMYATFSYDGMLPGVQWTALWYRGSELVHYETIPWDGGTGGYGFTEWIPDAEEWLPTTYQVQIFVGNEVKVVGSFEVTGAPATSSPTPTASNTATPTASKTSTPTITATHTRQPTATAGQ